MQTYRLAGPPGVGKTTVAWELARSAAAAGDPVAYVDVDQLGMCYPARFDDPGRWRLKEHALVAVAERFRRRGACRLVVSGVASPDAPPPQGAGGRVTSLWLDADDERRRSRLAPRGWDAAMLEDVIRTGAVESARLDPAWDRLSTDALTVAQTVEAVRARWALPDGLGGTGAGPAGHATRAADRPIRDRAAIPVLWITGPRCVGASRAGWELVSQRWRRGVRTGFVDAAQLDLTWNLPGGGADAVAPLHRVFAEAGAEELVVVAPFGIDPEAVRAAFPRAPVRCVRLDAEPDELRTRALARTHGDGPLLAGDDLAGAPRERAEAVAIAAARERHLPARSGEPVIETTGLDPRQAAERVDAIARRRP